MFNIPGTLQFVDRPVSEAPVQMPTFRIHPLDGGADIEAQPDPDGRFTLNKVRPGRYSLSFPMAGRIQTFANNSSELSPEGFELASGEVGPLLLVITMKSATVSVRVQSLPAQHGDIVALLVTADNHLTLRESCFLSQMTGPQTTFGFIPTGRYRIFIFDAQFQHDVAAYAPRFPDFLKNQETSIEVPESGQTDVTAGVLDGEIIKEAIRQMAPLNPLSRPR